MILRTSAEYLKWLTNGLNPMFVLCELIDMAALERIMTGDNEYVKGVFRELEAMPPEWWAETVRFLRTVARSEKKDR